MFEELETRRLILRKVSKKDINDIYEYGSDEKVAKYVSWSTYNSIQDAQSFINHVLIKYETDNPYIWAIEDKKNKKMIGTIDFVTINKKENYGEIGYVLNRNYWNQGIMSEALNVIIDFGFNKLNLNKIRARCVKENIASSKVLEKAGMKFNCIKRDHIEKDGIYYDLIYYSLLISDYLSLKKNK
ncbi:TPA: GNAT family N-acetyltransferase [bacterium]|nr:GNAT family N-acetyltransferase [bacterium]